MDSISNPEEVPMLPLLEGEPDVPVRVVRHDPFDRWDGDPDTWTGKWDVELWHPFERWHAIATFDTREEAEARGSDYAPPG